MQKNIDINVTNREVKLFVRLKDQIREHVDKYMESLSNIDDIIGKSNLSIMYDNHNNHIKFMSTVFTLNSTAMLQNSIPWVYHTYLSRGFSYDYFLIVLEVWKSSIQIYMGIEDSKNILDIYQWMIDSHLDMIELSKNQNIIENVNPQYEKSRAEFIKAILQGNYNKGLSIVKEIINKEEGLEVLYMSLIEPAMYQIGYLWENNNISIAEEHLATSIVSRIIATIYSEFMNTEFNNSLGIITSAPNEYHELGGRMLADLLDINGWNIQFYGSNTPEKDLIDVLIKNSPVFLGVSVTMCSNIDKIVELITNIRKTKSLENLKIIVGGQAFNTDPEIWKRTGADAYSKNFKESLNIINTWKNT
ncbi:MAG: cobalamin-dependent protein [Spirochaetales bacterium]|nr:cobalamin-dependent protein [Spirochaetales bacterium]